MYIARCTGDIFPYTSDHKIMVFVATKWSFCGTKLHNYVQTYVMSVQFPILRTERTCSVCARYYNGDQSSWSDTYTQCYFVLCTYIRTYFESPYLNMCISILFVVLDGIFLWLHAYMLGLRWFQLMTHSKRHSQILTARDKEETPEIEKSKCTSMILELALVVV